MFCNRGVNNRITRLNDRALILAYDHYKTSFLEILTKGGSFTVYHTNIQLLLLQMHKIKHSLSEGCLKDLFIAVNRN